jgi:hypothetical protein
MKNKTIFIEIHTREIRVFFEDLRDVTDQKELKTMVFKGQ